MAPKNKPKETAKAKSKAKANPQPPPKPRGKRTRIGNLIEGSVASRTRNSRNSDSTRLSGTGSSLGIESIPYNPSERGRVDPDAVSIAGLGSDGSSQRSSDPGYGVLPVGQKEFDELLLEQAVRRAEFIKAAGSKRPAATPEALEEPMPVPTETPVPVAGGTEVRNDGRIFQDDDNPFDTPPPTTAAAAFAPPAAKPRPKAKPKAKPFGKGMFGVPPARQPTGELNLFKHNPDMYNYFVDFFQLIYNPSFFHQVDSISRLRFPIPSRFVEFGMRYSFLARWHRQEGALGRRYVTPIPYLNIAAMPLDQALSQVFDDAPQNLFDWVDLRHRQVIPNETSDPRIWPVLADAEQHPVLRSVKYVLLRHNYVSDLKAIHLILSHPNHTYQFMGNTMSNEQLAVDQMDRLFRGHPIQEYLLRMLVEWRNNARMLDEDLFTGGHFDKTLPQTTLWQVPLPDVTVGLQGTFITNPPSEVVYQYTRFIWGLLGGLPGMGTRFQGMPPIRILANNEGVITHDPLATGFMDPDNQPYQTFEPWSFRESVVPSITADERSRPTTTTTTTTTADAELTNIDVTHYGIHGQTELVPGIVNACFWRSVMVFQHGTRRTGIQTADLMAFVEGYWNWLGNLPDEDRAHMMGDEGNNPVYGLEERHGEDLDATIARRREEFFRRDENGDMDWMADQWHTQTMSRYLRRRIVIWNVGRRRPSFVPMFQIIGEDAFNADIYLWHDYEYHFEVMIPENGTLEQRTAFLRGFDPMVNPFRIVDRVPLFTGTEGEIDLHPRHVEAFRAAGMEIRGPGRTGADEEEEQGGGGGGGGDGGGDDYEEQDNNQENNEEGHAPTRVADVEFGVPSLDDLNMYHNYPGGDALLTKEIYDGLVAYYSDPRHEEVWRPGGKGRPPLIQVGNRNISINQLSKEYPLFVADLLAEWDDYHPRIVQARQTDPEHQNYIKYVLAPRALRVMVREDEQNALVAEYRQRRPTRSATRELTTDQRRPILAIMASDLEGKFQAPTNRLAMNTPIFRRRDDESSSTTTSLPPPPQPPPSSDPSDDMGGIPPPSGGGSDHEEPRPGDDDMDHPEGSESPPPSVEAWIAHELPMVVTESTATNTDVPPTSESGTVTDAPPIVTESATDAETPAVIDSATDPEPDPVLQRLHELTNQHDELLRHFQQTSNEATNLRNALNHARAEHGRQLSAMEADQKILLAMSRDPEREQLQRDFNTHRVELQRVHGLLAQTEQQLTDTQNALAQQGQMFNDDRRQQIEAFQQEREQLLRQLRDTEAFYKTYAEDHEVERLRLAEYNNQLARHVTHTQNALEAERQRNQRFLLDTEALRRADLQTQQEAEQRALRSLLRAERAERQEKQALDREYAADQARRRAETERQNQDQEVERWNTELEQHHLATEETYARREVEHNLALEQMELQQQLQNAQDRIEIDTAFRGIRHAQEQHDLEETECQHRANLIEKAYEEFPLFVVPPPRFPLPSPLPTTPINKVPSPLSPVRPRPPQPVHPRGAIQPFLPSIPTPELPPSSPPSTPSSARSVPPSPPPKKPTTTQPPNLPPPLDPPSTPPPSESEVSTMGSFLSALEYGTIVREDSGIEPPPSPREHPLRVHPPSARGFDVAPDIIDPRRARHKMFTEFRNALIGTVRPDPRGFREAGSVIPRRFDP